MLNERGGAVNLGVNRFSITAPGAPSLKALSWITVVGIEENIDGI